MKITNEVSRGFVPSISVANIVFATLCFSLPFLDFAAFGWSGYVKPLALLVALALFVFQVLVKRASLSCPFDMSMKLASTFLLWGIIGAAVMPMLASAPAQLKDQLLFYRVVRDVLALSLGYFFYLVVRIQLRSSNQAVRAVRWMLASFWIVLVFCILQIFILTTQSDFAKTLSSAMSFFSGRQDLDYSKIFGLAPEASMLADQLMTMYLPFILAGIFLRVSVTQGAKSATHTERAMLGFAVVILLFTASRIGFITLVFLLICAFVLCSRLQRRQLRRGPIVGLALIVVIFCAAMFIASDSFVQFFDSFGGIDTSIEDGVWSNVTRAGSMVAGIRMFLAYPFGVGTGAFPFLFERFVPSWALASPEIQALMGADYNTLTAIAGQTGIGDITDRLPDSKALPIRVLAEMGLPGAGLLLAGWLYQLRQCWRVASTSKASIESAVAFGCVLSFLAMVPLSFSVNSYIWVHWLFICAVASALIRANAQRPVVAYSREAPA